MTDHRPRWVGDSDALAALARELLDATAPDAWIGVDTEFHTERRYHPELLLLQLATEDGRCWLVDPLSADLRPLAPLWSSRTIVAHGASSDVSLMHTHLAARPGALLDTQVLAGLSGHGYPRRLEDLGAAVLGEEPVAGATLSDWSQRPLSPTQQRYAAEDARLALRLARSLWGGLSDERRGWATECCAEAVEAALEPPDPDRRWRQLSIAPGFDAHTRAVLHALSVWREAEAQSRDQPPHFVVSDGVVLDVARRRPTSMGALAENRRISRGLLKRHGADLVRLTRQADPASPGPPVPSVEDVRVASILQLWAELWGETSGVAAGLVMPPEVAAAVAKRGPDALEGWRGAAVGAPLRALWEGRAAIAVPGGRPQLRDPL